MKFYIEGKRSSGEIVYWSESASQGAGFIPLAYSMAMLFASRKDGNKAKRKISGRYKGLRLSVRQYEPDNSDSYAYGPKNSDYA